MVKKKPSLCQTVKHGSPTNLTVRNLQPQDLGAVIFGCTNETFAECHTRQLFGLPRAHLSYVQNIKEGLPLFLFNYDDRTLHGIYEADSNGKFCPESNAWSHKGKEKTGYPAQVAMRLKLWCFPLAESQFRNAILTNYYQRMPSVPRKMCHFFHFELDHEQTHSLMNMFTPLPSPYNFLAPPIAAPVHGYVRQSKLPPVRAPQFEGNSDIKSDKAVKPYADVAQKEKHEKVGYVRVNSEHDTSNSECPSCFNDLDSGDTPSEGRDYTVPNKDAEVQELQSDQLDKKLSLKMEKFKMPSPQQRSSELCANATAAANFDTYSCKDAQEVKGTILDGPSNRPEKFDAEVHQLSLGHSNLPVQLLDFNSCTEAKYHCQMMNTGCTVINELSPSPPAVTQQFRETGTQLTQAVYETPNDNNGNGALEATDPAGHPQSHCAESTSIQPLTISSSQECMRDENSVGKRKKRKRKTGTLAIQGCPKAPTAVNQSSPSPPAITQQFQETKTQQTRAVYETPNNNNGNCALEATDPAGHPQSHCAESTSIQPLTISSSQECVRGESSLKKGSKRKRKTATLAIQGCPNAPTAVNKSSPSPPAITQQFQETETQLTRGMFETPSNNNGNRALEATDPAGHPQSHCAESKSIQPFTISSSQECVRGESSLRKGRNWKRNTATLAIQSFPNGHDEKHNKHPTELQYADYTSWYVKDRLIGKITCMICGEEGHYTCDCPMKDQENKVMCTLCNKVGHCYLWCCRQYVSETRACRRCGEKGHYTNKDLRHYDGKDTDMYIMCSSCDESHPLGRCPMGKGTCFLCEGKGHVPAHCRFSPMLTVTQYYRESFRAILKQALTNKSRRAVKPVGLCKKLELHDDSHECQFKRNDKMVHTVSSFIHCDQDVCEKSAARSVPDSDKTNHAALTEKALTQGSSSVCFNCHVEGHYANRCPKMKPPGEQELCDVTFFRFRAKKCHNKKKPTKLELCDVTCYYCHDKGHYSYSCPVNKPSGGLELHDVTCINFDANRRLGEATRRIDL